MSVATPPEPDLVARLLHLLEREPGRPRLTWYGTHGERIELSGHVLGNWVVKTTNLLVEEFDARPGVRIVLDLPPHWRTVVWALASWRTGATVILGDHDGAAVDPSCDVVVTDQPERRGAGGHGAVVAVALASLARRWDGELPNGAVDATSAVMTYADTLVWAPAPDGGADALLLPDGTSIAHRDLAGWAAEASEALLGTRVPPRVRALVPSIEPTVVAPALAATLVSLGLDGSIVLLDPTTTAEGVHAPERLASLRASERTTA